jgi:hypothetical protein
MTSKALRRRATIGLVLLACASVARAASSIPPARQEKHTPESFDRIFGENALFFSLLVTFSATAALSQASGVSVKDINVNLITRAVRDARGNQLVRVRVAGTVRKNHNVELDLLDPAGVPVGKSFFGYYSGQLTFYDRNGKAIIDGSLDSRGNFSLSDLRLPRGKQALASGYVDDCFNCSYLGYGWWDARGNAVGGGRIYHGYPDENGSGIQVNWTFDRGRLGSDRPAFGEAEYDLAGEATGAINSVLFDTDRTAASFFANPYSLLPEPAGKGFIPRFTDDTGIAVTNPSNREISVTYVARRFDGSLVSASGIENPVTYRFSAGQQYAAYPGEIFSAQAGGEVRPFLEKGEVGWLEIFCDNSRIAVEFLEAEAEGTALDGNVGAEGGASPIVFADLRLGTGESTEIELLNLAFDDVIVRLELLDRDGRVLLEEREFFVAGYGMRSFFLGPSSNFLRPADPSRVGSLRVSCNNTNSIRATGCARLVGLATFRDRFGSVATSFAVSVETAATVLVGAYFATGPAGRGTWRTTVSVAKLDGNAASVYLEAYDRSGNLVETLRQTVAAGGQATFALDSAGSFRAGYVKLVSDSGKIAGDLSLVWSDGEESQSTAYPLSHVLSDLLHFNQVAQGQAGGIEYWTGVALMNDSAERVDLNLDVYRPDGAVDRTVQVRLDPFEQRAALLSELLGETGYTRVDGYLRITASKPISAIVLYGDASSRFLAAVPGVAR